jgi:hypothetical protein
VADKLRQALDRRITVRLNRQKPASAIALLQKLAPGLVIRVGMGIPAREIKADIQKQPLGAALQLLEDEVPGLRVVVREYGLLIADKDYLPPGAVPLAEFWKGSVRASTDRAAEQLAERVAKHVARELKSSQGKAAQLQQELQAMKDRAVQAEIQARALRDRNQQMEKQLRELTKDLERLRPAPSAKPKALDKAPSNLEGLVQQVENNLATVNIGSDAGLARGHTLEVYRLGRRGETAKYLGKFTVIEVTPTRAVCKVQGKLKDPVKVGDSVSSQIAPR